MSRDDFGQLALAAVYQLKNALAAAQGYASMMDSETAVQQYQSLLVQTLQRAQNLLYSLESYRTFVHRPITPTQIDINHTITATLAELATDLQSRQIEVAIRRSYQMPAVSGDPDMTAEIIRLILFYILQLPQEHELIITVEARRQAVLVRFTSPVLRQSHTLPANGSLPPAGVLNGFSNEIIILLAKVMASHNGGRLWLSGSSIGLRLARSQQLSLIGEERR